MKHFYFSMFCNIFFYTQLVFVFHLYERFLSYTQKQIKLSNHNSVQFTLFQTLFLCLRTFFCIVEKIPCCRKSSLPNSPYNSFIGQQLIVLSTRPHNLLVIDSLQAYLYRMKQYQLYNENKELILETCKEMYLKIC